MMKPTQRMKLAAGILSALTLLASVAFAEMRTWTDDQGRKIEAEFVGTQGAGANVLIKLKLADGRIVPFPLAKLTEADQLYAKANLPKDPFALAAEIDKLVKAKAQEAYYGLRDELAKVPQDPNISPKDKAKRIEEIKREMEMAIPNELTNDEQFMRRIYLDICGRIPTYEEAEAFLSNSSRSKRAELINELLETEAFAMHLFNFYSDLLRIRDGVTMMGNGNLRADPYIEWVKQAIRDDKPYNEMVKEMITAEGKIWDNPAAGYLMTDTGMRLCNLSNTFTVFLGTEITCAQCHDHPFEEIYQMDFFRLASFMGQTEERGRGNSMMMMSGGDSRQEIARMSKLLKDAGKLRENETTDRQLRDIFGTHSYYVHDTGNNKVRLPHDYKYDDGDPNAPVQPGTYFGDVMDLEKYESPREAYAEWIVSPNNPRFTVNIVNRLWKRAFGVAQIEPVYNIPGHLDGQAQNYDLLVFLEKMFQDLDYSVKDFYRVIYNSETYQREAETMSPSLTQMDKGTYHFPGPILRRMTAEQLWDSLVALTTPDPDEVVRRGWDEYRELMHLDTTELKTVDAIMNYKNRFRSIGGLTDSAGEMEMDRNANRIGGQQMVRASEMRLPQQPGHFLRMFGQSDKKLIENQFTVGSSPQVMALLNGSITNKVLTDPKSYLVQSVKDAGSKDDKIRRLFVSILGREPTSYEEDAVKGLSSRRSDDPAEETGQLGDVIWALVNTREFMFIQ